MNIIVISFTIRERNGQRHGKKEVIKLTVNPRISYQTRKITLLTTVAVIILCSARIHGHFARSIHVPPLVSALHQRLGCTCTFLLVKGRAQRVVRLQRALPFPSAALLAHSPPSPPPNCSSTALYVCLDGLHFQEALQEEFARTSGRAAWLVFSRAGASPAAAEELLGGRDAPWNSLLLAARRTGRPGRVSLWEVWRVAPEAKAQRAPIGRWDGQRLTWATRGLSYRRKDLTGLTLRIVTRKALPVLNVTTKNNHVILSLFIGEMWNLLRGILRFRENMKEYKNVTTDEILEYLRNPEVQIVIGDIAMSTRRINFCEQTIPIYKERISIFVRHLGHKTPRWFSFLEPFAPSLWVSIAAALLATAAGMQVIIWCHRKQRTHPSQASDSLLCAIAIFSTQGCEPPVRSCAARLLQVTAYLTAALLLAAYSGQLVSRLAVRRVAVPFSNTAEFLFDRDYPLLSFSGTYENEILMTSRDPTLRSLAETKIQLQEFIRETNIADGVKKMCTSRVALYSPNTNIRDELLGSCGVISLPGFSVETGISFILQKNSPYKRALNRGIALLLETGVAKKLLLQLKLKRNFSGIVDLKNVGFPEIVAVLTLLGVACIISLVILAYENCIYYNYWKKLSSGDTGKSYH